MVNLGPYEPNRIYHGHALELAQKLPDNCLSSFITSPPYYGLRDYGIAPTFWPSISFSPMAGLPEISIPEQVCCLGLEKDIWSYAGHLVTLFRELRRALHPMGTLWLNLGDSFSSGGGPQSQQTKWQVDGASNTQNGGMSRKPETGLPAKNLMLIPARVALALQADGWWLRSDIIWHKPNPMPESVTDRPTKSHEYVFLFSKSDRYFYDKDAIKEPAKEVSLQRLGRGVSETHKMVNGAPVQVPHSLSQPRLGVKFGGRKADGYGTRIHSGKDWEPVPGPVGANKRTVWTIATQSYSEAHFAVFPPALVEPMVLASTSEQGNCPACGNPWVRVVEKVKGENSSYNGSTFTNGKTKEARQHLASVGEGERTAVTITTGWQPSCSCNAGEPVPALILDPFSGSGTVARVAAQHRRHYLGFELNEEYLDLTKDRATVQVEMF